MKFFLTVCVAMFVTVACGNTTNTTEHVQSLQKVFIMYDLDFEDEALSEVLQFVSICGPSDVGHAQLHLSQKISASNVIYTLDFCPHILHHADDTPPCILKNESEEEITSLGPAITLKANRTSLTNLLTRISTKAGSSLVFEKNRATIKVKKPLKK